MAKKINSSFYELLWVLASLSLSFILLFLLTGGIQFINELNVHLYDTFYIIKGPIIISFFFLVINFILYAIKEAKNSFKKSIANLILVTTSVLLILMITVLQPIVTEFSVEQWNLNKTVFGPPKAESKAGITETNPIGFILIIWQVIVLIFTLYSMYKWGTYKQITGKKG